MKEDYKILKQVVSSELCDFLALEYQMMEDVCITLYQGADLSDLCKNTFARYSPLMFEAMSVKLLPIIEKATGMRLWPTYSYARIYYKDSELQKHFDRPSSEITVSLCVSREVENWPLKIQNENGRIYEINLDVGDVVIYSGRKHLHWRDPYQGSKQIQAFMQYVDADGKDAWLKWDTRPKLGLPFEWADQKVQNEIKQISVMEELKRSSMPR